MRHHHARRFCLALILMIAGRHSVPAGESALWGPEVPLKPAAHEYYVAPTGAPANPGTREAPWDLASALAGKRPIAPGDILWIGGGQYRGRFELRLAGAAGAPIHVRARPGERATILDSGLTVVEPAHDVWLWDLEIAGTTPLARRRTEKTGSHPADLGGTSGLEIRAGRNCRFINLDIHDNNHGGVGWWVGSTDSEMIGCLIHDNGWSAPDRSHGHCIYVQNREGRKTIRDCIMSVPLAGGQYSVHAYGSERAFVDNFLITRNIIDGRGTFLVGGGAPSHGIRVLRNYLFHADMQLGYGAENEDCEVRGNIIAGGKLTVSRFRHPVVEENITGKTPASQTIVLPNPCDPRRANLAIFNGRRAKTARVDPGGFLKPGQRYRLLNPRDFYGRPVAEGRSDGGPIQAPTPGEFAAYVLMKEEGSRER